MAVLGWAVPQPGMSGRGAWHDPGDRPVFAQASGAGRVTAVPGRLVMAPRVPVLPGAANLPLPRHHTAVGQAPADRFAPAAPGAALSAPRPARDRRGVRVRGRPAAGAHACRPAERHALTARPPGAEIVGRGFGTAPRCRSGRAGRCRGKAPVGHLAVLPKRPAGLNTDGRSSVCCRRDRGNRLRRT